VKYALAQRVGSNYMVPPKKYELFGLLMGGVWKTEKREKLKKGPKLQKS